MFSNQSKMTMVKAALNHDAPVYVQFFVTARCNLTCKQCNVIYSNADVRECTLDEVKRIADNFKKMGVAMVVLTGGEPFIRQDLPEMIREFESRGIHVRMQTNGLATEEQIHKAVEYGAKDVSISLDSLDPAMQDDINGGFAESWHKALKAIALFTKYLPKKDGFGALGCVMQSQNLHEIENIIRFGSEIGWHSSLVPIHVSDHSIPLGFRTLDKSLKFKEHEYAEVDALVERVRKMRDDGYLVYDSDQFFDDVKRFVRDGSSTWRDKNGGVCDSPGLYFTLLPNGHFAVCCDYRLPYAVPVYAPDFPKVYHEEKFRKDVYKVAKSCTEGCMYGCFPEITISSRFMGATFQRAKTFFLQKRKNPWPLSYEQILEIAKKHNRHDSDAKNLSLAQKNTL